MELSSFRNNNDLHIHLFVSGTTYDGTNNLVVAGFGWGGDKKILNSWHQQEVPPGNWCAIFRAKKREAVNGTIAIAIFGFHSSDAETNFLSGGERDHGLVLACDFVAAVAIGEDFDQLRLRA